MRINSNNIYIYTKNIAFGQTATIAITIVNIE